MFDAGLISNNNQSLHSLEKTLLDLASSGVAQATIFLILFQFKGQKILRFLESGSYLGFLHQEGLKVGVSILQKCSINYVTMCK